jgi:hypothetical protein
MYNYKDENFVLRMVETHFSWSWEREVTRPWLYCTISEKRKA